MIPWNNCALCGKSWPTGGVRQCNHSDDEWAAYRKTQFEPEDLPPSDDCESPFDIPNDPAPLRERS